MRQLTRSSHLLLWTAIVTVALRASPAFAATFDVRKAPYGAAGDGAANDYGAIDKAIHDAIAAGSDNTVLIPAGTYRLATSTSLYITNANGLTIRGEPGTLLIAATNADVFNIGNSSRVAIEMITIDTEPMRYTQGVVNSLSADGKTLTVTLDDGFPTFTDPPITNAHEMVFWTDPNSIAFDRTVGGDDAFGGATHLTGNQWSVTSNTVLPSVVVGKQFVVWYAYQAAPWGASVNGNPGAIAFTDFTVYGAGGGACVGMSRNSGPITLTRVKVGVPPGSKRLIATSGGFTAQSNGGPITFDDCDVSRTEEDTLDIGGDLAHVLDHPQASQILVEDTQNFAAGDTVQLWDWTAKQQHVRDTAKIKTVGRGANNAWLLTLDHEVAITKTGAGPGDTDWSNQEADGIDRCINLNAVGPVKILNSRLQTSGRHFVLKAPNSLIENCSFYDTPWGIFAAAETFWHGGPAPTNLTIRNNTFRNMGIAPIELEVRYSLATGSCRSIRVEGNTFVDTGHLVPWSDGVYGPQTDVRGGGVCLRNTDGAVVVANRFVGNWGPPIIVDNSSNILLDNNAVSGSHHHTWSDWGNYGVDMSQVVYIHGSDHVTLTNNLVSDLGMYASGLASAVSSSDITGLTTGILTVPALPADSAIVTWLRADAIVGIADAEGLTTWTDSSAMGHYAAQPAADRKPAFAATAIGKEPAVHFDDARSTSFTLDRAVQDDFTIMLVFRSAQGAGSAYPDGAGLIGTLDDGSQPGFGLRLDANGRLHASVGSSAQSIGSGAGLNDGHPHVATLTRTRSTGMFSLYVDGKLAATGAGATDAITAPSRLILGATSAAGGYLNGDLAEVRVANYVLSDATRTNDENGLIQRFGVTPSDGDAGTEGGPVDASGQGPNTPADASTDVAPAAGDWPDANDSTAAAVDKGCACSTGDRRGRARGLALVGGIALVLAGRKRGRSRRRARSG